MEVRILKDGFPTKERPKFLQKKAKKEGINSFLTHREVLH